MYRTLRLSATLALIAISIVPTRGEADGNEIAPELTRLGQSIFAENCAICHGATGKGDGALASEFQPRPRNFTNANFKFKTSVLGEPPTRADLIKVIERGIEGAKGRTMPAFADLTSSEKIALADVIRQFAGFETFGTPFDIPQKPQNTDFDRARVLYNELGCSECHGKSGQGDGDSALALTDEEDNPIRPTNFYTGSLKGGSTAIDIWFRMYSGIGGTPMPAFGGSASADELWEIALLLEAVVNK